MIITIMVLELRPPEAPTRLAQRRTFAAPFVPWLGFGMICAALILYLRP